MFKWKLCVVSNSDMIAPVNAACEIRAVPVSVGEGGGGGQLQQD